MWFLWLLSGAGTGAYVGAKAKEIINPTPQETILGVSPLKIAIYAAGGMALFWVASKTGTAKSVMELIK